MRKGGGMVWTVHLHLHRVRAGEGAEVRDVADAHLLPRFRGGVGGGEWGMMVRDIRSGQGCGGSSDSAKVPQGCHVRMKGDAVPGDVGRCSRQGPTAWYGHGRGESMRRGYEHGGTEVFGTWCTLEPVPDTRPSRQW